MPSLIQVDGISSYTLANPVLINDQFEIGPFNAATGQFAFASGLQTVASGNHSSTRGFATTASGNKAHAEGNNTTASGESAHAEGWYTNAIGNYSHAEGNNTTASAQTAHAEGGDTTASGISSHAEGINTISSGNFSHAEGSTTVASGQSSHAEGGETTAIGIASHAEGISTIANGVGSHAEGHFTIADGNYSHVTGRYNLSDVTEGAFIVGNGTSGNNRSNLLLAAANQVEVFGNTKTETIQIAESTTPTPGHVLTTDAQGNGTWQAAGAGTDTFVTAASLNGSDLEIDRNQGQPQITVDLSPLTTPDTFVISAALTGTDLEINRNNGEPQITVDLSSLVDGTNNYVTTAVLNGSNLELTRFGLPTLVVDLSPLLDDTTATVDADADPNVNADVVFYSASIPGGTIYLNSALNIAGKKIVLIRTADTNTVTLAGSVGAQINGSGTKALPTALYSTTTCISDGTNFYCTNGAIL